MQALRLSKASEGKSSAGQIVNLLSNDVSRFDGHLHFISFLFVGPVQLVIFFYLLWEELGWACLAGVGYVVLLSPSQCKPRIADTLALPNEIYIIAHHAKNCKLHLRLSACCLKAKQKHCLTFRYSTAYNLVTKKMQNQIHCYLIPGFLQI